MTMPAQAWMGIGSLVFFGGLFLVALWRGLSVSKFSLLGIDVDLPKPMSALAHPRAKIPALLFLITGATAFAFGNYLFWFPPSSLQIVTVAETPAFDSGGQTESAFSDQAAEVTFVNKTQGEVDLYWIDTSGTEVRMDSIASNQSRFFNSYVGHLWVAKAKDGTVLLRYVVRKN